MATARTDLVESLIRSAGRRIEPPDDAYEQVFVAAHRGIPQQDRAPARAIGGCSGQAPPPLVVGVALVLRFTLPDAPARQSSRASRASSARSSWRPATPGSRSRNRGRRCAAACGSARSADGRAAFVLAGRRIAAPRGRHRVMLDAPGRCTCSHGTIYVDGGARPGRRALEVVTPAGTARDLGTQFELQVAGAALRLRVREGRVAIDRGGRSLTGRRGRTDLDRRPGRCLARTHRAGCDGLALGGGRSRRCRTSTASRPPTLIAWVARETGRRLRYESPVVEQRAATVILHGDIRHLAPLAALEAMLATTDLDVRARRRYHGDPRQERRTAGAVNKLALLLALLAAAAEAASYRGLPLEAVLERLRAGGLELLYSSDLVKPWMRVEREPRASEPRALLAEILAPHGITLARRAGRRR